MMERCLCLTILDEAADVEDIIAKIDNDSACERCGHPAHAGEFCQVLIEATEPNPAIQT